MTTGDDTKPARFGMRVRVAPADIDGLGHVNNAVYLRWVQEIATAHWESVAAIDAQEQVLWVVVRHEIDYKAPALPDDEISLETWVGNATRATFERFTEIRRAASGRLLAQARTLWCPIDAETRRPVRVPQTVREQFSAGQR